MTKTCSKCAVTYADVDAAFYPKKAECRKCLNARQTAYRSRTKKYLDENKRYRQRKREARLAILVTVLGDRFIS